jgi:hypothetical protein
MIRKSAGIRQGPSGGSERQAFWNRRLPAVDRIMDTGHFTDGVRRETEELEWYQERGEHFSHTGASSEAGLKLPPV